MFPKQHLINLNKLSLHTLYLIQRQQCHLSSSLLHKTLLAMAWQQIQACAAPQVAALPLPDEAETANLTHELLMIEAVLADLRKHLKSKGHDAPDTRLDPGLLASPTGTVAQGQPEAACVAPAATAEPDSISWAGKVLDDGLTSKVLSRCPGSSERQQLQLGGRTLPSEMAAHSMLYGTDRSLGDIDAVMQARGYR